MAKMTLLRAGPLTTVQDLGRQGHRALGVSSGGALDLFAARIANLLAGNSPEAALLEVTLGGSRFLFDDIRRVAWCGGDFLVQVADTEVPAGRAAFVRPGEELKFGTSKRGARAWLAIAGGIDVPEILGSRATDLRASFGGFAGRCLRDGDELSLGNSAEFEKTTERFVSWSAPADWARTATRNPILRVVRGAEWEMFSETTRSTFLQTNYTVTTQADRMGVRLRGAALARKNMGELLSEAVAPGTVQVANDAQPILLLGDCQTIGGYPKIAHVIAVDLAQAAQLLPNDVVRFQEVTLADAVGLFRARENDLQKFRIALDLRRA